MPAKPRVKIDLVGNELTMAWRTPMLGVSLFLMLWLTGWTAGCGVMLYKLLTDFEWFMLLFSVPFFTAWFVVAGLLVYLLFGRHQLVLTRDSLEATSRALVPLKHRVVPLDEVAVAQLVEECTHHSNDMPQYSWLIRISTLGDPVKFAKGIEVPEGEWLAETINLCLNQMSPERAAMATTEAMRERDGDAEPSGELDPLTNASLASAFDDDSFQGKLYEGVDEESDTDEGLGHAMVFVPGRDRWEQPSDSRWQLTHEGSGLVFTNRGRWSLVAIGGSLFICLFWNGIVGVFVWELINDFRWFLALFLIPFEVIGLVMLFTLLAALTAPAWGTRCKFRLGQIERRWWTPLFGRTKRCEFDRLDRIELASKNNSDNSTTPVKFATGGTNSGEYRLALIDTSNTTLLDIDSLTKGEALWMADTLTYELPGLFDRDR
ncbi:hypothetical protein NG895_25365 [Aeoliella sp. ICT_H6.2]|uniref:Uncharacterized protein n=1 Tax=Aeoliella straminimaris TaxID=2954799 RepID=A0A9X2FFH9_9BACT|nr:hypothetical protein [Aeoliella straminimaris]MCO6047243.1 hypothetical protein [Aeoliella straminimaris]